MAGSREAAPRSRPRPPRLTRAAGSTRGMVAALLPAAYVAVPYLVGIFSVRASLRAVELVLLGGLYVGFVGRILLKDFRDVRATPCSASRRSWCVTGGRARAR